MVSAVEGETLLPLLAVSSRSIGLYADLFASGGRPAAVIGQVASRYSSSSCNCCDVIVNIALLTLRQLVSQLDS